MSASKKRLSTIVCPECETEWHDEAPSAVECPNLNCKFAFEVDKNGASIQYTSAIRCPKCGEEWQDELSENIECPNCRFVFKSNARDNIDNKHICDKAIRLFSFLRELTKLRTKTIRSIDQYEKVLWFDNIPKEPGCHCIAWGPVNEEDEDVWVEIKKPRLKPPPEVPANLKPWMDHSELMDSSLDLPSLKEKIPLNISHEANRDQNAEQQIMFQFLQDSPEIENIWNQYVERNWWPWAEEDRRLQKIQRVYANLFSIYQKQQRLGEAYEVILGLGYLTWKTPSDHEIKRHVIVAQTNISFNATTGTIKLGPAGEGAKPSLEQEMLEPQECPDFMEQNAIEQQVSDIGDSLWDGVQIKVALKAWVHSISPKGQFDDSLVPQTAASSDPKIAFAPALILRKRTERSLLRVFQDIIEQLTNIRIVPPGIQRLVTIIDDGESALAEISSNDKEAVIPLAIEEIYFPLPANDEQLDIVKKISTRQGILVQGPPGTGKSHTIANLICHILAKNQRVLVTSHTARALKVLKQKLPKEISDLCVILLGDDLEAMQALEVSVRGITSRYENWQPSLNRQRIEHLEKTLHNERESEAMILSELRAIREAETYKHPPSYGNYEGTTQRIAKRLREEESRYSWMSIRLDGDDESPLTNEEAKELLLLLREIDKTQEKEIRNKLIDPNSLIKPADFVVYTRKESETLQRHKSLEDYRKHPAYTALSEKLGKNIVVCPSCRQQNRITKPDDSVGRLKCGKCQYQLKSPAEIFKAFENSMSTLARSCEDIDRAEQPWSMDAMKQILTDHYRNWFEMSAITKEHLKSIEPSVRDISETRIVGLDDQNRSLVKAQALSLLEHLEAGGKLGFWFVRPKAVKKSIYLIKKLYVEGYLCDNINSLKKLIRWIDIADRFDSLNVHWSQHINAPCGSFLIRFSEYSEVSHLLEKVLECHENLKKLREIMAHIPNLPEPIWHNKEERTNFLMILEAISMDGKLQKIREPIVALEDLLRDASSKSNTHHIILDLLQNVRERNVMQYERSFDSLLELRIAAERLKRRDELLRRMESASKKLVSDLKSTFDEPVWDERMAEFSAACNWVRADSWLKRMNDPHRQEHLSANLELRRSQIRDLLRDIAEAKAWGHCFSRLTEEERQHLKAWTMAMRRIGKGTGKYASRHRRDAREHMEHCRSAIPAWIMPIYRVAETVKPGRDAFDVVIIDEASQSGPEAIFLQYLAKKIIVVGDDKQISPDFVGMNREDVELLRKRYISDLPHNDALGVDHSFFDQAVIRYGGRIRLREHFRCMPEIIQFSNNLCYGSEPLIPLRQYGAGRLTPIIIPKAIAEGYQKGHSPRVINPPEAEAIVNQIELCCKDSKYDERTMGVISLLGEDQARYIEQLLLDKIGPEEIEKRHLVCGDAYAFQGDERDVMFLSLVSAPTEGSRIGTLASPRDERRFNVAASRAKDQMWLFHSATLNDLSPKCLRSRLLEYCYNPKVQPSTLEGVDIENLRIAARASDRDRIKQPSPFGSWFELDVYLMIFTRGYRVIPQYEVTGYFIDFVVEGMRGRLAVECDGDAWHGAENYEADMARQRMLERCGWTFWRIRGSAFYRNQELAMEGLWKKLNDLKIKPVPEEKSDNDTRNSRDTKANYDYEKASDNASNSVENALSSVDCKAVEDTKSDFDSFKPQKEGHKVADIEGTDDISSIYVSEEKLESASPVKRASKITGVKNKATELASEEKALIEWIASIPHEVWFSIARWAKENNRLESWERSLVYNIGILNSRQILASTKQAKQASRIYDLAMNLGFNQKEHTQSDTLVKKKSDYIGKEQRLGRALEYAEELSKTFPTKKK